MRGNGGECWRIEQGPWSCKVCGQNNKPKSKVCLVCGVRRQHGEATGEAGAPSADKKADASTPTDKVEMTPEANREELSQKIRLWEQHVRDLPQHACFETTRSLLSEQISAAKRQIIQLKPLSAQLESCRQAQQRAQQRQAAAASQAQEAQQRLDETNKELQQLNAELAALEIQQRQENVGSGQTQQNCLGMLKSGMEQVCAEMASGAVDRAELQQAQVQMASLFQGLSRLAETASTRCAPADTGQMMQPSVYQQLLAQAPVLPQQQQQQQQQISQQGYQTPQRGNNGGNNGGQMAPPTQGHVVIATPTPVVPSVLQMLQLHSMQQAQQQAALALAQAVRTPAGGGAIGTTSMVSSPTG